MFFQLSIPLVPLPRILIFLIPLRFAFEAAADLRLPARQ